MMEPMMTKAEVAELVGVSAKTVGEWISTGALGHHRMGHKTVRVSEAQLRQFLAAHEVAPEDPATVAVLRRG